MNGPISFEFITRLYFKKCPGKDKWIISPLLFLWSLQNTNYYWISSQNGSIACSAYWIHLFFQSYNNLTDIFLIFFVWCRTHKNMLYLVVTVCVFISSLRIRDKFEGHLEKSYVTQLIWRVKKDFFFGSFFFYSFTSAF